jgi:hypothetical protein
VVLACCVDRLSDGRNRHLFIPPRWETLQTVTLVPHHADRQSQVLSFLSATTWPLPRANIANQHIYSIAASSTRLDEEGIWSSSQGQDERLGLGTETCPVLSTATRTTPMRHDNTWDRRQAVSLLLYSLRLCSVVKRALLLLLCTRWGLTARSLQLAKYLWEDLAQFRGRGRRGGTRLPVCYLVVSMNSRNNDAGVQRVRIDESAVQPVIGSDFRTISVTGGALIHQWLVTSVTTDLRS